MSRGVFRIIVRILPFLIFFLIVLWEKSSAKKHSNDMKLLYSDINGRVKNLIINRGVSLIRLDHNFGFISIGNILKENGEAETFHSFVQVGDSIYSPYSSDSIYVIRGEIKKGYRMDIEYAGKYNQIH